MSTRWTTMLDATAARAESSGSAAQIVTENAVDKAQLVDLSSISIVDIAGDDAAAFLQGQFCNDLTRVSPTQAQITGYCTPKGRLLALPTVAGTDAGFRLLVPADIRDGFLQRLSMFVMRSKVTIAHRADCLCTGVLADANGDLGQLAPLLGALPGSPMNAATGDTLQTVRWHDDQIADSRARYLLLASEEKQLELWAACPDMPKLGAAVWRLGDISAGVPGVRAGVQEAFVPQMLNLQLIDALSFTKGCYPGQEIVARMQYLGKLKRHMHRFRLPPGASGSVSIPLPGTPLHAGEDTDAGVVVDAILGTDGQAELLAVVKVSAPAHKLTVDGQVLVALDLPYTLPTADDTQASAG